MVYAHLYQKNKWASAIKMIANVTFRRVNMRRTVTFEKAFERVIGHEAGYTTGRGDPGGETKYGISKRQYPHLDIKNLTLEQAKQIYKRDYWDKIPKELPPYIKFQVFDFAVNHAPEYMSGTVLRMPGACGV